MAIALKTLVVTATGGFWVLAGSVWLAAWTAKPADAKDATFSAADIAKHNSKGDCWFSIRDGVYDVTTYVPQHPSPPQVLLDWCGKDATVAFDTKQRGRPHSDYAVQMLPKYRVGTLRK